MIKKIWEPILGSLVVRTFILYFAFPFRLTDEYIRYDAIAMNLTHGLFYLNGVPATEYPPLYIFFLSCIYKILGHHFLAVFAVQAVISIATLFLVYALSVETIGNEKSAVLACWMVGLFPGIVGISNSINKETLLIFLIMGFFYFWFKRKSWIAGVFLGLANLTRPISVLLPIFLMLFPKIRKDAARVALISYLIITPWIIRDYIVTGHFILVTTDGGSDLYCGNLPNISEDYCEDPRLVSIMDKNHLNHDCNAPRQNSLFFKESIKLILHHPLRSPMLWIRNSYRMWITGYGSFLRLYPPGSHAPGMLILAAVTKLWSILILITSVPFLLVEPLFLLFYFAAMHSIMIAMPNHAMAFWPLLIIFSSNTIVSIIEWKRTI